MSVDDFARQEIADLQAKVDTLEGNTLHVVEALERQTRTLAKMQAATTVTLDLMRLSIQELVAREKNRRGNPVNRPGVEKTGEATT